MRTKLYSGIVFFVAASLPNISYAQSSQAKAQTFALGVNGGFASTQIYEPSGWGTNNNNDCYYNNSYALFQKAITDANQLIDGLKAQGITLDSPPPEWRKTCALLPEPAAVESWRTATQVKISRQDGVLGQIYGLGINVGIAEAQASLGDARRQTVYMALQNALPFAKALGLDTSALSECILLAGGTTPMAEIHSKILLVRTTYQASM